jgi:hypothetical protein
MQGSGRFPTWPDGSSSGRVRPVSGLVYAVFGGAACPTVGDWVAVGCCVWALASVFCFS